MSFLDRAIADGHAHLSGDPNHDIQPGSVAQASALAGCGSVPLPVRDRATTRGGTPLEPAAGTAAPRSNGRRAVSNPFPAANVFGQNHAIWKTNLTDTVKADFLVADYDRFTNAARLFYAQEGGLEKNDLFIADWLSVARTSNLASATLGQLCQAIINFARAI